MLLKPTVQGRDIQRSGFNSPDKAPTMPSLISSGDYAFSQACYLKDNTAGKHMQHFKVFAVIKQL